MADIIDFSKRPKKTAKKADVVDLSKQERRSDKPSRPRKAEANSHDKFTQRKNVSSSHYIPGENLRCRIISNEPGGYSVLIVRDNLPGFLPTLQSIKVGTEVDAQFVCVHNNRILVSKRFGNWEPTPGDHDLIY